MPTTPDLTLKAHDTYPTLKAVLSDSNGAIPLTGATQVKLIMKGTTAPSPALVSGAMVVASAAGGYVTYQWAPGDTAVPDTYNVEFEIAWQAGGIETVPNDVYRTVKIVQDLNNA